jgi:hypothetical protein
VFNSATVPEFLRKESRRSWLISATVPEFPRKESRRSWFDLSYCPRISSEGILKIVVNLRYCPVNSSEEIQKILVQSELLSRNFLGRNPENYKNFILDSRTPDLNRGSPAHKEVFTTRLSLSHRKSSQIVSIVSVCKFISILTPSSVVYVLSSGLVLSLLPVSVFIFKKSAGNSEQD